MQIKNLIIILFIGLILSGLMAGVFILAAGKQADPGRIDQNQTKTDESHAAASISKGTILLLLAVGVIGALGVSRKKNGNGSYLDRDSDDQAEQAQGAKENHQKLIGHKF